MRLKAFTQTN